MLTSRGWRPRLIFVPRSATTAPARSRRPTCSPSPNWRAVSSLQIRTGSTVVDGWLMERAKARDTYAANPGSTGDAAILEQEREDVVTIRVGTIAPHERVEVRFILHARLTYTDGQVLFRFPLVVAPRYIPGARLAGDPVGKGTVEDTDLVPDASRLTPPVASEGRVRLSVSISVASGAYAIDEIGCTLRTHISGARPIGQYGSRHCQDSGSIVTSSCGCASARTASPRCRC